MAVTSAARSPWPTTSQMKTPASVSDNGRTEKKSPRDSIYEAALLRFRPIMMTTSAAILGALPLCFSFGVGSELRQPLGISIVGGLMVSQVLTLYTTPVVYLVLDRLRLCAIQRGWVMGQRTA